MNTSWIRTRRKRLRITLDELAARLELEGYSFTSGAISHWENERYSPPMDDPLFRKALASALRMTVSEMLIAMGYETNVNYTDLEQRAASIIRQLPESEKDFALDLLESILAKSRG